MQKLNFPQFQFRFKNTENSISIFDVVRKKFVVLQPEEWVRQNVVRFINETKGYPLSLINVEKQLTVNGLKKRYDVIVFNSDGTVQILVECKAPEIEIHQHTFDQIAIYNRDIRAKYLMITNGISHYYCHMDHKAEKYHFLKEIPDFNR